MKRHLVMITALCWVSLRLLAQTHQHRPANPPAAPTPDTTQQQPQPAQPAPMPGMQMSPTQQTAQTSGSALTLEQLEQMAIELGILTVRKTLDDLERGLAALIG